MVHRKKSFSIFPSPARFSLTKLSLGGNNFYMTSLFPPRESLVSDIPAGESGTGILKIFFYGVAILAVRALIPRDAVIDTVTYLEDLFAQKHSKG
jgi:hypothetical protein